MFRDLKANVTYFSAETAVVFKNHPIPVISTDQRERRNLHLADACMTKEIKGNGSAYSSSWSASTSTLQAKSIAEAQTNTGTSPKGAIYTSLGWRRYNERFLLAVSPQPQVTGKKNLEPCRGGISRPHNRPRCAFSPGFLHRSKVSTTGLKAAATPAHDAEASQLALRAVRSDTDSSMPRCPTHAQITRINGTPKWL